MLSLYHPGDSLLHRARAGLKLAVLCLGGTLAMFTANPWVLGAALAVLAGLYALARVPARLVWRLTRHLFVFVAILAGLQWACASAELAALVGLRLALLIGGATLLTLTTRTSALIDAVEWLCRPLRVFGVQPDRIGVTVSLTLRFIPVIGDKASAIREAQAARGVRTFRSFLVPLLVATLRAADGVGEALDGRGLEPRPQGRTITTIPAGRPAERSRGRSRQREALQRGVLTSEGGNSIHGSCDSAQDDVVKHSMIEARHA